MTTKSTGKMTEAVTDVTGVTDFPVNHLTRARVGDRLRKALHPLHLLLAQFP